MEGNLLAERIDINSVADIDKAIERVLSSEKEYFEFGTINLEPCVFRFKGGRFDKEFVPIEVLKIARVYRTNFVKYFTEATGKKVKEDVIYFNIERKCFEIDFQNIIETVLKSGVDKMNGVEITLVLMLLIGAWFASKNYKDYLDSEREKHKDDLIERIVDKLTENKYLEASKNEPPNKAIDMIDENEILEYGNEKNKEEYSTEDIEIFEVPDVFSVDYKTIVDEFRVRKVELKSDGIFVALKNKKYKKFEARSRLSTNEPLYIALEKKKKIPLKVSIGTDGRGMIVDAEIYEVVEDSAT